MPCKPINLGGGATGIVCTRERRRTCSVTGCYRSASLLCDFPLAGRKAGKTCNRALCSSHAVAVQGLTEPLDYCPAHATLAKEAR